MHGQAVDMVNERPIVSLVNAGLDILSGSFFLAVIRLQRDYL
jgi:hypothetical protein